MRTRSLLTLMNAAALALVISPVALPRDGRIIDTFPQLPAVTATSPETDRVTICDPEVTEVCSMIKDDFWRTGAPARSDRYPVEV